MNLLSAVDTRRKRCKIILMNLFLDMIIYCRQLAIALESLGVSPTGDMEMVQQIKDEVRRLCTRGNIAAKIAHSEAKENREEHHERFFNIPASPTSSPVSEQFTINIQLGVN